MHSMPTPDTLVPLLLQITKAHPIFGLSYELGSSILVAPSTLFSLIGLLSYLQFEYINVLCLAEYIR